MVSFFFFGGGVIIDVGVMELYNYDVILIFVGVQKGFDEGTSLDTLQEFFEKYGQVRK